MRILVLNGSPHPDGATADMVAAFEKGAKEAGHDVAGIFTTNGEKNKSEEKRQELYTFGKNLKGEHA